MKKGHPLYQACYGGHSVPSLAEDLHGRNKHRSSSPGQHFTVLTFSSSLTSQFECYFFTSAVIKIEIPCEETACHHVIKAKTFAFKIRTLFCQEKSKTLYAFVVSSIYSKCVAFVRRQREKSTYYRKCFTTLCY